MNDKLREIRERANCYRCASGGIRAVNYVNDVDVLFAEIARLSGELEKERWIPVDEKLPDYDRCKGASAYWIAFKDRNGEYQMRVALYSDYMYATITEIPENITFRDYDSHMIKGVTHWRPLPAPPQGKDGEI